MKNDMSSEIILNRRDNTITTALLVCAHSLNDTVLNYTTRICILLWTNMLGNNFDKISCL